jgi:hypothetical protein
MLFDLSRHMSKNVLVGNPKYVAPIYNCRNCNFNLAGNDPATQYQRQKIIQNTVRVYASLYTANLGALTAYKKPLPTPQLVEQAGTVYEVPGGVNWNQMSDRYRPSVQVNKTASGSTYHPSSTRHTIVRNRPNAMSPGGVGVDIKHNSYERYLNRLKGKGPLRRGVIPPQYGEPIPFNRAFPIYGGKTIKTDIVTGCDCPDVPTNNFADKRIYGNNANALQDEIYSVQFQFHEGDIVFARKPLCHNTLYKAKILQIYDNSYTVEFLDDDSIITTTGDNLSIYFDCNCESQMSIEEYILANQYNHHNTSEYFDSVSNLYCELLNKASTESIL